jgi:uncharacterized protein YndB with AHSA1/START domain
MTNRIAATLDPALDLVLERTVDVAPKLVWAAWTTPDYIKKWFTPAPWQTVDCEIDLRPGGLFRTVMRGPTGQEIHNSGCYLEVVENKKLVWTTALKAGYRPQAASLMPLFTAMILFEPHGIGTRYTAIAIHGDAETTKKHADMGFHDGWGKALDQLVSFAKTL